jgi:hypothetical protein
MFSIFSEFGTLMKKASALIKINRKNGEGISYTTTVLPNAWAGERRKQTWYKREDELTEMTADIGCQYSVQSLIPHSEELSEEGIRIYVSKYVCSLILL